MRDNSNGVLRSVTINDPEWRGADSIKTASIPAGGTIVKDYYIPDTIQKPVERMFRFNSGKVPLSLVPTSLNRYAAYGLWYGAIKYEAHNWRKGGPWTEVIDSMQRHLDDFKDGIDNDPESALPHLAHMACNLAFLIEFFDKGVGQDDRYRVPDSKVTLKFNEPAQKQKPL